MDTAIQREKRIKKWNRAWKLELIEKDNPDWRDLAEALVSTDRLNWVPAFAGMTKVGVGKPNKKAGGASSPGLFNAYQPKLFLRRSFLPEPCSGLVLGGLSRSSLFRRSGLSSALVSASSPAPSWRAKLPRRLRLRRPSWLRASSPRPSLPACGRGHDRGRNPDHEHGRFIIASIAASSLRALLRGR